MSRLVRRLFTEAFDARRPSRGLRRAADLRVGLLLQALEGRVVPAPFTVLNTGDSGTGSLRQAILDANTAAGADTILFNTDPSAGTDFSTPQTITLTSGALPIMSPMVVAGQGSAKLTISGNNTSRVFVIDDAAISSVAVTLAGMTVTNGQSTSGAGGGIVMGNENVTILNSVISGNSVAASAGRGGGGGIAVDTYGSLTVRNTTISGNVTAGPGAGIYFYNGGSLLLENSTISGNSQTGNAIGGGGIYFTGAVSYAGFVIRNSTISGNTAVSGGGLRLVNLYGDAVIENSTITNNTVTTSKTGAGDAGGGIAELFGSGTIILTSSIVAGNLAPNSIAKRADVSIDGSGLMTATFSAIGADPGIGAFTPDSGFNLPFGAALNLQPLANNGGPTQTHALGAGSAAIDKGANPDGLATDQRGGAFARVNGLPDIGAVEAGTVSAPVAFLNPTTVVTNGGGTTYAFQVTYADATAINASTVGPGDVRVTGPGGFNVVALFVGPPPSSDGTPRTATYAITPPGGFWDAADYGDYTVAVEPGQVLSTSGPAVAAGSLGTFLAALPTTFTVTNANDSGPGSLRQAILDSNARVGSADTILFDSTFFATPRTISLTAGELLITDSVTITGPGVNLLTVRHDPAASARFRIIEINESGTHNVTLSGMTLTGGNPTGLSGPATDGDGGGIFSNIENVTLLNVAVTGNSGTEGGGVAFSSGGGSLTVRNSTISGNTANGDFLGPQGGGGGGGIYISYGGSLLLENSTISGNLSINGNGGGLYLYGYVSGASAWTIRNSTLSGNTAAQGAGLFCAAYDGDRLLVENSTISGNSASEPGGGVLFYGSGDSTCTIRNSTLSSNRASLGGGVFFSPGEGLLVQNSTLSGNSATIQGGGIYFYGITLQVQNSTISGNTAGNGGSGGGISFFGPTMSASLLVQNSTITNNRATGTSSAQSGGGIFQPVASVLPMTIVSSIVSGNTSTNGPDIRSAGPVNVNFSAVGSPIGFTPSVTSGNNQPGGAALNLQPLANNGGPTQTHALGAGSQAIDNGSNPAGLTTDQRGAGFVRSNGPTDIGAFEAQTVAAPPHVNGVLSNGGAVQRSVVKSLTVTFDKVVVFANNDPTAAFTLTRLGDGAVVTFTATADNSSGMTVVTLTGLTGTASSSGSLADGRYTLRGLSAQITAGGQFLDGNGDGTGAGTPADDFVFADSGASTGNQLYRLFGESNGDRVVNALDFNGFRLFNGATTSDFTFDSNGDGVVNALDFNAFRLNNGANI